MIRTPMDMVADMLEGGFCFPVLCELAWGPLWQRPRKVAEAFAVLPAHVVRTFATYVRRWDCALERTIEEYDLYRCTRFMSTAPPTLSIVIT